MGTHGGKDIVSDSYGERYATTPIPKYHLASKVCRHDSHRKQSD